MCFYDKVSASVAWIREKTEQIPELGVILGSGLGGLADELEERVVIPYGEIPNFPRSQVEGHAGNLVIGSIGGKTVAALQGRFHYYEGFSMKEVTFPVYVLRLLGVRDLIVTNACGGINRSFAPGDLMLITDYINMLGQNSLMGDNDPRFGPRFPDMSEPYAAKWIRLAERVAEEWAIPYQKGVYALFPGPCYETAAEIRAYAALGANAIGMSTVPETITANYLGMGVLGVACITNMATGIAKEKHTHEEVLRVARESGEKLRLWLRQLLLQWPGDTQTEGTETVSG